MLNGINTDALGATIDAVKETPGLAHVTFGLQSEWQSGCRQQATTTAPIQDGAVVASRKTTYTLESDEPEALLGTDTAASPGEYLLQALAACYAVTFATNAAVRGIKLNNLKFELSCDFDLHGFLGLDKDVHPGAQEIRVSIHAESPDASDEQLQELVRLTEQRSPIRDTLGRAVAVETSLAN